MNVKVCTDRFRKSFEEFENADYETDEMGQLEIVDTSIDEITVTFAAGEWHSVQRIFSEQERADIVRDYESKPKDEETPSPRDYEVRVSEGAPDDEEPAALDYARNGLGI